jgi:hypothetical protein
MELQSSISACDTSDFPGPEAAKLLKESKTGGILLLPAKTPENGDIRRRPALPEILLSRFKGTEEEREEFIKEIQLASMRAKTALAQNPYILTATLKEPVLEEVLFFHQFVAKEFTQHYSPVRHADHDIRVTEHLLKYSQAVFGFFPLLETIATAILHDSKEDYKAKGWVISEFFGHTIEGMVDALSLPEEIKNIQDKVKKAQLKHEFKMNSVHVFSTGQCAIKHFDGLDVLIQFMRDIVFKRFFVSDDPSFAGKKSNKPVLPKAKFEKDIYYRYEFFEAIQKHLMMAHHYHWMNHDGFDCPTLMKDFRRQFAMIGMMFAQVVNTRSTGRPIKLPAGLLKDIHSLSKNDQIWCTRNVYNMAVGNFTRPSPV